METVCGYSMFIGGDRVDAACPLLLSAPPA
jgi:hypothetical protein